MTVLESRLSKLEAAVGVGLSPQEQFRRLVNGQSDETLLTMLHWLRARIAGTDLPSVPDDVAALMQRLCNLMSPAD